MHNLTFIQVFEKLSYRPFLCFVQVPLQLCCITLTCDNWVYFSVICKDIQSHLIISGRSLIYNTKRNGPSTEPWGTPLITSEVHSEWVPFNTTLCKWPERKFSNHNRRLPLELVSSANKNSVDDRMWSGKSLIYNTPYILTSHACHILEKGYFFKIYKAKPPENTVAMKILGTNYCYKNSTISNEIYST